MPKSNEKLRPSDFGHVLMSCEHASNFLPREFRQFIPENLDFLSLQNSHRGFDEGAFELAKEIALRTKLKVFDGKVTRLLVDLNRDPSNPTLHFKVFRNLSMDIRAKIVRTYHAPHRKAVSSAAINKIKKHKFVTHFSVHSFTPVLNNRIRKCDIGILFDPRRPSELRAAKAMRAKLKKAHPKLIIWFNHPYRGYTDGLTTWMRTLFPPRNYCGIELEINQRLLIGKAKTSWPALKSSLADALCNFLKEQRV